MGKISNTYSLMGDSWEVIKNAKEIIIFQIISGISCLIIMLLFLLPIFNNDEVSKIAIDGSIFNYVKLYLYFFINYFIVIFFNVAIIHCALLRMDDQEPTIGEGISAAMGHLPAILGWTFISATVGFILRVIEERSEVTGQIVVAIIGIGWTMASFLVIPVMVVKQQGPISAMKDSAELLKKSWGEQILGNLGFGFLFLLLACVALIPAMYGFNAATTTGKVLGLGIAFFYLIILSIIHSAMFSVFQAALYLTLRNGEKPEIFKSEVLSSYR